MTRTATANTAVRRRVDVSDGRLVIRTIVVETPEIAAPSAAAAPAIEPVAGAPAGTTEAAVARRRRLPAMRPAKRIG